MKETRKSIRKLSKPSFYRFLYACTIWIEIHWFSIVIYNFLFVHLIETRANIQWYPFNTPTATMWVDDTRLTWWIKQLSTTWMIEISSLKMKCANTIWDATKIKCSIFYSSSRVHRTATEISFQCSFLIFNDMFSHFLTTSRNLFHKAGVRSEMARWDVSYVTRFCHVHGQAKHSQASEC